MALSNYETKERTAGYPIVRDLGDEFRRLIAPATNPRPRAHATTAISASAVSEKPLSLEPLLTARDVAKILHVHENYVYDLAASGQMPSYKIGGNRRFRRNEIEEWLDQQRSGTYNPPRTR